MDKYTEFWFEDEPANRVVVGKDREIIEKGTPLLTVLVHGDVGCLVGMREYLESVGVTLELDEGCLCG